jgi:hypothetical protein
MKQMPPAKKDTKNPQFETTEKGTGTGLLIVSRCLELLYAQSIDVNGNGRLRFFSQILFGYPCHGVASVSAPPGWKVDRHGRFGGEGHSLNAKKMFVVS